MLEDNLSMYEEKIEEAEKSLISFQSKNKNRIKRHELFIERTTRKMELDEILENIQSDLNDIQEKVKDAEADNII